VKYQPLYLRMVKSVTPYIAAQEEEVRRILLVTLLSRSRPLSIRKENTRDNTTTTTSLINQYIWFHFHLNSKPVEPYRGGHHPRDRNGSWLRYVERWTPRTNWTIPQSLLCFHGGHTLYVKTKYKYKTVVCTRRKPCCIFLPPLPIRGCIRHFPFAAMKRPSGIPPSSPFPFCWPEMYRGDFSLQRASLACFFCLN